MKNNAELQEDVQKSLKREPLLHAAEIGVTVKDGVVSLTGVVDSYVKKNEAEHATKRVRGVKAIVENIEVKFPNSWSKTDKEVADEVLAALKTNYSVPHEKVMVKVENGKVTLSGELLWNYQVVAAKDSIDHLIGVKGVNNNITIQSELEETIEKEEIEKALDVNGSINNRKVTVTVKGNKVSLTGSVGSKYQKEKAGRIAWNSKGVSQLNNALEIKREYVYS